MYFYRATNLVANNQKLLTVMGLLKLSNIPGRQQGALLACVHLKGPQRPWWELPRHMIFLKLKFLWYVAINILSVPNCLSPAYWDIFHLHWALGSPYVGIPLWLRWWGICLQCRRPRIDPWVRKIHWRRKRLPTPVFLPDKAHGQRSLVSYSSWGRKESDMTERLTIPLSLHILLHKCAKFQYLPGINLGSSSISNSYANVSIDLLSISPLLPLPKAYFHLLSYFYQVPLFYQIKKRNFKSTKMVWNPQVCLVTVLSSWVLLGNKIKQCV